MIYFSIFSIISYFIIIFFFVKKLRKSDKISFVFISIFFLVSDIILTFFLDYLSNLLKIDLGHADILLLEISFAGLLISIISIITVLIIKLAKRQHS